MISLILLWSVLGTFYFIISFYFMGWFWRSWECNEIPHYAEEKPAAMFFVFLCGLLWIVIAPAYVAWKRGFRK